MNTSMPSPASDLAALVKGGTQTPSHSQLRGMFAGLTNSKHAPALSGSSAKRDFRAMLDAPGKANHAPGGAAIRSSVAPGHGNGEDVQTVADDRQSGLTNEPNFAATSPLQIKGMATGLRAEESLAEADVPPANPGTAQPLDDSGEKHSDSQPATPILADPASLLTVPDATKIGLGVTASPSTAVSPGCKPAKPGTAPDSSWLSGGWNPTAGRQSAKTEKNPNPGRSNPITTKSDLPAANDPATGADPTGDVSVASVNPAAILATTLNPGENEPGQNHAKPDSEKSAAPSVTVVGAKSTAPKVILSALVQGALPLVAVTEVSTPAVQATNFALPGEMLPVIADTVPLVAASAEVPAANQSTPANTVDSSTAIPDGVAAAAPVLASAPALLSRLASIPVAHANFAPLDALLTATKDTPVAAVTTPGQPEDSASIQIPPEVRRDVVETVAAMLIPFLTSLPAVILQSVPVTSGDGLAGVATAPEAGKSPDPVVTIKIGNQPSFNFELPSQAAPLSAEPVSGDVATADLAPALAEGLVSPSAQGSGTVQISDQLSFFSPTAGSALPGDLLLDFRIQLKTKIEAAWRQADQSNASAAVGPEQLPADDNHESPGIGSSLVGTVAVTPSPEQAQPVADNAPAYDITASTDVQPPTAPALDTAIARPPNSLEVMIQLPGMGAVTAQIVSSRPVIAAPEKKSGSRSGYAEKNAGDSKAVGLTVKNQNILSEKTFLTIDGEPLNTNEKPAGTDVAKSDDSMPAQFTSRRVSVDQLEFPPRITGREILPALSASQNFAAPPDSPTAATPAPVLAHRAVETIQNVVEAQRSGSANASSVNLHFKFGGDDLAVRVQMRGGEVLTQFLTDSPELRSAITSEWQRMAGQGGVAGLRMLEPVIMPSSAGVSTGFGSTSQGQNQAQQNAQQQQAQSPESVPEMRALRRGANLTAPLDESAPSSPVAPSTSRRLTALA